MDSAVVRSPRNSWHTPCLFMFNELPWMQVSGEHFMMVAQSESLSLTPCHPHPQNMVSMETSFGGWLGEVVRLLTPRACAREIAYGSGSMRAIVSLSVYISGFFFVWLSLVDCLLICVLWCIWNHVCASKQTHRPQECLCLSSRVHRCLQKSYMQVFAEKRETAER